MPHDYKKLHEEWKEAKKDAKLFHDAVVKLHMDLTNAHEGVKIELSRFPKFDQDLGPSLDDIHKNKNVAKAKKQAEKALKQYLRDIANMQAEADKLPPAKPGQPAQIQSTYLEKQLPKFYDLCKKIEKAVDEVEA